MTYLELMTFVRWLRDDQGITLVSRYGDEDMEHAVDHPINLDYVLSRYLKKTQREPGD